MKHFKLLFLSLTFMLSVQGMWATTHNVTTVAELDSVFAIAGEPAPKPIEKTHCVRQFEKLKS